MKTMSVFALLVVLATPVFAYEAFKGFRCDNACPLAQTANSHRANGTEALAASSVARADVALRIEKNLAKI
ncbi:MAG TPA: hypothetical protein VM509_12540 [Planctomycetota bacterium]|nr:hypothetical protein [Planctomycetota bacterium]